MEDAPEAGVSAPARGSGYGGCDDDGLVEALVQVGCLESATRLELVRMAAEVDARELWAADGQSGLEAWLELQLGLRRRSAAEIAGVARVIGDLPALARAFGEGRLSWDQLVALCALATGETDAEWAAEGPGLAPETLWAMLRARRCVTGRHARSTSSAACGSGVAWRAAPGSPPWWPTKKPSA